MTTGEKIRAARKRAGLTQKELAEKLGVTGSLIGIYETDRRKPKNDTLDRIASALGVPFVELLSDEDSERIDRLTSEIKAYNKALEISSQSIDKCVNDINKLMGKHNKTISKPTIEKTDDAFYQSFRNAQILNDTLKSIELYINTELSSKTPSDQAIFLDSVHSILEEYKESMQRIELLIKEKAPPDINSAKTVEENPD